MLAEQSIDFTRGDVGWIIWICIPLLVVLSDKGKELKGGGRRILKILGIRLLAGFVFTALVIGQLSMWARFGPQYFVKLRLQEKVVCLTFRGSATEVEIPLREVKSVTFVDSGTFRHPCKRLQIETPSREFQSFGFKELDADQLAVVNALRSQTGATIQLEQP